MGHKRGAGPRDLLAAVGQLGGRVASRVDRVDFTNGALAQENSGATGPNFT